MAIDMEPSFTGDYAADLFTFRKPELPKTIEEQSF